nr:hypothetical protein [uncultured Duganella sp.]
MARHNFALSAEAGLTVLNWSKLAQGTVGTGDVVAWSGTKGLFGGAVAVGLRDIRFNQTWSPLHAAVLTAAIRDRLAQQVSSGADKIRTRYSGVRLIPRRDGSDP